MKQKTKKLIDLFLEYFIWAGLIFLVVTIFYVKASGKSVYDILSLKYNAAIIIIWILVNIIYRFKK